jgi:hypothetical protein
MGQILQFDSKDKKSCLKLEKQQHIAAYNKGLKEQPVISPDSFNSYFWGCKLIEVNTHWNNDDLYFAQVKRNKAIRIRGIYQNDEFDKVFLLGNIAEYDSYNLSYTGKIVSITDKTVSIQDGSTTKRLKLTDFIWRNHNFSLAETKYKNSVTMQSI